MDLKARVDVNYERTDGLMENRTLMSHPVKAGAAMRRLVIGCLIWTRMLHSKFFFSSVFFFLCVVKVKTIYQPGVPNTHPPPWNSIIPGRSPDLDLGLNIVTSTPSTVVFSV